MTTLRLMSHNQWRCDNNQKAWEALGMDCSSAVREEGFARVYAETQPDIVGIQEISGKMTEDLMASLAARGLRYALLWGHDTPILYRPDKFELVDSTFALYPLACPGEEGEFNNSSTKSRTVAVFREKDSGKLFVFTSTHLWWMSDDPAGKNYRRGSGAARVYQIGLAMDDIDAMRAAYGNCPAILVGDMNTPFDSPVIRAAFARGYRHAHDLATDYADSSRGHHACGPNGFSTEEHPGGFVKSIDHILIAGAAALHVRRFERYAPEYYMPLSDHAPVYIDAEI